MLTIRLQRTGKANRPDFRVVVTPKTSAPKKKFLEVLASYNPRTKQLVVKDKARIDYWLSQNIQLSPTVHNLFVSQGFVQSAKVRAFKLPKKAETPAEEVKAETVTSTETAEDSNNSVPSEQPADSGTGEVVAE